MCWPILSMRFIVRAQIGPYIDRVIVRGRTDFGQENATRGDGHSAISCATFHCLGLGDVELAALAGKRELAAVDPVIVLIDDLADGLRIGGVAHAIENDLRHGGLALDAFTSRLKINACRQAFLFFLGENDWRQWGCQPIVIALTELRDEAA